MTPEPETGPETPRPDPETPEGAAPRPAAEPGIDRRLLDLLVCPVTRGALTYDRARQELVSRNAGLAFPIHDGVPVMLAAEARKLD